MKYGLNALIATIISTLVRTDIVALVVIIQLKQNKMLKLLLVLIIGMVDFVLVTQGIFPALGCGSTIGESIAFLSLFLLGMLNYILFQKLFKTK